MAKKKTKSKLVGFARLRVTDPDKLKAIAKRAGKRAQQLHGKRIRWSKTEAQRMARAGGRAVQRQYQKEGHPLQIAQVKREAAGKKIRAGIRKRKAKARAIAPIPVEVPLPELEPGPDKDVING